VLVPNFELSALFFFIAAAAVIAVTPGPGIFYVAARTLAGGRAEGLASSFGTGVGGMFHVVGGAIGVSALVMASAEAFTVLRLIGASYLLWLGVKTIREAGAEWPVLVEEASSGRAFREGIIVETLNPKTAAFFLAFIPQFVDPGQNIAAQFVLLGVISVALNTGVDVVVACLASRARSSLQQHPQLIRRLRESSGLVLCGLGTSLLFANQSR
jgi:threonine/homoserine/homoserine lactone efflux protein